jgi:TfoX/Sxy family transcriptional regulator of competence genes
MASSKEYLEFILGQLSELEEITYRRMTAPIPLRMLQV